MTEERTKDFIWAVFLSFMLFFALNLAVDMLFPVQEAVSFEEATCRQVCDAHNTSFCGFAETVYVSQYAYCLCSEAVCSDESLLLTTHKIPYLLGGDA